MGRYSFDDKNHIHKLDGKNLYGTTTILGALSKPLTWWASGKACEQFGWINPKPSGKKAPPREEVMAAAKAGHESIKRMDLEGYVAHLNVAYKAHAQELKDSAVEGVDLHGFLESYIKDCLRENDGEPLPPNFSQVKAVQDFATWAMLNVGKFLWSEAHHYSERLWVGGISDFAYTDKSGLFYIGDFKRAKGAYFSHFVQMAAYDIQIQESGVLNQKGDSTGIKFPGWAMGYIVFPFGREPMRPEVQTNVGPFKRAFEGVVEVFKAQEYFEKPKGE